MTSIRGPSFSSTSANSDIHTDVGAGRLRARKYIFVVGGMQNLEDYQGPGNSDEVQNKQRVIASRSAHHTTLVVIWCVVVVVALCVEAASAC